MKLLISVRSVDEALIAAHGGADLIDLKEPAAGALGGLPVATVRTIVGALRVHGFERPISATIGDLPMQSLPEILSRVEATGACGIDYVKVGIEREPQADAVLGALASCGRPVVPVFLVDRGLDLNRLARAAAYGFPALMLDTSAKSGGSLLDRVPAGDLQRFITLARAAKVAAGLAGALRIADVPALAALAPDFIGFRSALSAGERSARLDPDRLQALLLALRTPATA